MNTWFNKLQAINFTFSLKSGYYWNNFAILFRFFVAKNPILLRFLKKMKNAINCSPFINWAISELLKYFLQYCVLSFFCKKLQFFIAVLKKKKEKYNKFYLLINRAIPESGAMAASAVKIMNFMIKNMKGNWIVCF